MTSDSKIKGWDTPALQASIRDGMFHSLMVGAGESFLPAFGIFLLGSSMQIGILTSLPPVVGAILQCIGVLILDRASRRKNLIARSAVLQALVWIPIALIPFTLGSGTTAVWALIGLVCLYHGLIGFGVPIWNSLIGDLVPQQVRGEFFGYRNKLCGSMTFAALAISGIILDSARFYQIAAFGYLLVFLFSCGCRLRSAYWLERYDDPEYKQSPQHIFSLWDFFSSIRRSNFAKFVFFVSSMSFAVNIAGPYFSVYMLRDLKFTYTEFMAISGMNIFAQFVTIQRWGKFSDTFGNRKILAVSAFGVALCPLIWLSTDSFWVIFAFHLYNGFVWAGFNLSAANFMFDAVTPPKRGRCSAYQALATTVAVLCGSLIGGFVATHLTFPLDLHQLLGLPVSPYPPLFVLSFVLRLLVIVLFLRAFKEVRDVENIGHRELVFRITHLRPLTGATFNLVSTFFRNGKS